MKYLLILLFLFSLNANAQVCFGNATGCPAITNVAATSSNFLMANAVSQTIAAGTEALISFTTIGVSSTAAFGATFSTSTGIWTPNVAGTYEVRAEVNILPASVSLLNNTLIFSIDKNGVGNHFFQCRYGDFTGTGYETLSCGGYVAMNGTTDNMNVNLNSPIAVYIGDATGFNRFTAVRLGP